MIMKKAELPRGRLDESRISSFRHHRLREPDRLPITIHQLTVDRRLRSWALNGDLEKTKISVSRGADVNSRDNKGRTALMNAAMGGYDNVVEFLLSKGADPKIEDNDGFTAMSHANKHGHKHTVRFLSKFSRG